jgi:hypothetical protein
MERRQGGAVMSEPKRYKPAIDWDITGYEVEGVSMDEVKDGKWVSYSDYARLKAEVERLTDKIRVSDNHAQCLEFVINSGTANELRLQAQVERLTKAALQVYQELDEFGQVSAKSVHELRDAAKGVQS